MGWLARLCLLSWTWLVGCVARPREFCKGMEGDSKMWHLEVPQGESRSLSLPLDATIQKLVFRCDSKTGKWKELLLAHADRSYATASDVKGISLFCQNFTVGNADSIHEGLYKISKLLISDETYLALVNVTVLDHILFVPTIASSTTVLPGTSQNSTSGTSQTSPGSNITVIIAVVVLIVIIAVVFVACIQRKCNQKMSTQSSQPPSAVENEPGVNALLPHQQQGNQLCMGGLLTCQKQGSTMV